jgi:hypothetical protein
MGWFYWLIAVAAFSWANNAAAEPIYLTTTARVDGALGNSYTFIGPYFTSAESRLFVQITKQAPSQNSQNPNSGNPTGGATNPTSAVIYHADWIPTGNKTPDGLLEGKIRYSASCDLSKTLTTETMITVSGITPTPYNTPESGTLVKGFDDTSVYSRCCRFS